MTAWQQNARRCRNTVSGVLAALSLGGCDTLLDPDADVIQSRQVVAGGFIRFYEWAAPGGSAPRPVLLAFHGAGGNPNEYRMNSELVGAALDAGYVIAFPQAPNETGRTWAMGCASCTDGDRLGIDDVAFVDVLLDDLATRTAIDRTRVYATGFSMGGWFTYALACQRSTMIRAIAPVGGLMPRPVAAQCAPQQPIGALVIFGDRDQTQPYDGRTGPYGLLGVDSSAFFWSQAARCRTEVTEESRMFGPTEVRVVERDDCDGGIHVERHRVVDLTHVWPRGRYSATREILRFFATH